MIGQQTAISRYLKLLFGVSAMSLCAFKCSGPQREFLAVQVCLVDERGEAEFVKAMREVARLEGLRFLDNSADTESYLRDVRDRGLVKLEHVPTINVGIEGENGLGVTAGNLGLPSNQVALGFTAGSDAAKARRLSNRLVGALSQRWRVEKVPAGKGAFPMESCKNEVQEGKTR